MTDRTINLKDAADIVRMECGAWTGLAETIVRRFKKLPPVDAVPVRRGRWKTVEDWDGDEHYQCSECKAEYVLIDGTPEDNDYLFCPHCGADMREDGGNDS